MPWHIDPNHAACKGYAVVKDSDNSVAGCHKTKAAAAKQLAALYAGESKGEEMEGIDERAVDNSTWDGNKAMGQCSSAADYRKICAGEKSTGEPDQRQHWALPHHYLGRHPDPNAAGVRAALARFGQTEGLSNASAARAHLERHMSAIQAQSNSKSATPPRDDLFRAQPLGYEVRDDEDGSPVLAGHFAIFNEWTEINSMFEGHFLERIIPGAFKKTFSENRDQMRALFQHGRDPQMGDKVLGPIDVLEEDDKGARYEVPLLDGIPPLLLSGLRKNLYGASFRFRVIREEFNEEPGKSKHNPEGLPERDLKEIQVREFGPVTFPAYANASAGIRSLTDEFVMERMIHEPGHLAQVIEFVRDDVLKKESKDPPSEPSAGNNHPRQERRASDKRFTTREEFLAWLSKS
jgi:HK97 family phage prohead protease